MESTFGLDLKEGEFHCTIRTPAPAKKLLMVALVESIAETMVVRECKGISKTYLLKNKKGKEETYRLQTEGVNFAEILQHRALFDVNTVECNDIGAILAKYGVESARAAIMEQIGSVFGAYGITVNPRHLMLVADYMTFEGDFKPFNRIGLATNPSPLQKMTFETTSQFLKKATLFGEYDTMSSPSSRIVLGRSVNNGTGSVVLRYRYDTEPEVAS